MEKKNKFAKGYILGVCHALTPKESWLEKGNNMIEKSSTSRGFMKLTPEVWPALCLYWESKTPLSSVITPVTNRSNVVHVELGKTQSTKANIKWKGRPELLVLAIFQLLFTPI